MAVPLKKLGIIAGGGALPRRLLEFCESRKIDPYLVGLEGHVDPSLLEGREHMLTRPGAAGSIMRVLHEKNIRDLVLIGTLKRPRLAEMRPDFRTLAFYAKLGLRALGDDGLLKAVRAELESDGFVIHGIHEIMPDLFIGKGVLGRYAPDESQGAEIAIGLDAARALGIADIGQGVVVHQGIVVDREDEQGTDVLLQRAARRGAIFVKSSKPQQDRKLDLPTIGPDTIALCVQGGYAGIAAEAGGVLLAVPVEQMAALADEHGLFVVGI
ncbi:MAG: UDP-2,3-diacylglucosamine diphosphatase LpxI [Micavibrio sp.]